MRLLKDRMLHPLSDSLLSNEDGGFLSNMSLVQSECEFYRQGEEFVHSEEKEAFIFLSGWSWQRESCPEVVGLQSRVLIMAPSTQADEVVSGVRKGIRAVLLGPPGAGKGTQVSSMCPMVPAKAMGHMALSEGTA